MSKPNKRPRLRGPMRKRQRKKAWRKLDLWCQRHVWVVSFDNGVRLSAMPVFSGWQIIDYSEVYGSHG